VSRKPQSTGTVRYGVSLILLSLREFRASSWSLKRLYIMSFRVSDHIEETWPCRYWVSTARCNYLHQTRLCPDISPSVLSAGRSEIIEAWFDKKCARYLLGWSQTLSCWAWRIRSNPRKSASDPSAETCKSLTMRCTRGSTFYTSLDLVESVSAALILPGRMPLNAFWIHPASKSVLSLPVTKMPSTTPATIYSLASTTSPLVGNT